MKKLTKTWQWRRNIFTLAITLLFSASLSFVKAETQAVQKNAKTEDETRPADIRRLEVASPIGRELKGDQTHVYEIVLEVGQYLSVIVEQRGVDVVIQVIAPDDKQLMEVDSPNGRDGPELVKFITEFTGKYKLIVRSLENNAPVGKYEIRIVELRPAIENDRGLLEVERLNNEVMNLYQKGKYQEAIPLAERALAIREKSLKSEDPDMAESLDNLAMLYAERGNFNDAEPLLKRALAIREKARGAGHPDVARSLNRLAHLYHDQGDFIRAESLQKQALAIREKALEPDHLDIAESLNNLATLYLEKGNYKDAEALYKRALAIVQKRLGPEQPEVASILDALAQLSVVKGNLKDSESLIKQALAIRQKTLPPDHPDLGISFNTLAVFYYLKGESAKAEPLFVEALAIFEKAKGKNHPDVASIRSNLIEIYRKKGATNDLEKHYQEVLNLRKATLPPNHPDVAVSLINLAGLYFEQGAYSKAEPLYQQARAIYEAVGPDHLDLAGIFNNLAVLSDSRGEYDKTEQFYQRALSIYEKVQGSGTVDIARTLNNLAAFYFAKGEYSRAVLRFQQARDTYEKALGATHPEVAGVLNNLAHAYRAKGDFNEAEPLYQRALAIYRQSPEPDTLRVALVLNNLAVLYDEKGESHKTEQFYQQALAIYEQASGLDHPDVATVLNNLADIYRLRRAYDKAERGFKRALMINEKALGPDHPNVAATVNNLASVYRAKGEYDRAEPLFQRALAIYEKALGPNHPNVALSLSNLMLLQAAKKNYAGAIAYQSRACEVSEHHLALNIAGGSDRQKLLFLATLSTQTSVTLALHTTLSPHNPAARQLALTTLLRRKGRALDSLVDDMVSLRNRLAPQDQKLLDQLRATRARLAALVTKGPSPGDSIPYLANVNQLERQVESLEAEISRVSPEFSARSKPVTIQAIQDALPTGAVLIEYVRFYKYDFRNDKRQSPCYAAYIIDKQRSPAWVNLGDAKPIEDAVGAFRKALGDKRRKDVKQLSRAVDRKVMQSIRKRLGAAHQVFVSPDGELNLIPFAALVNERGEYLVKRYHFTYLTSGRDLIRLQTRTHSQSASVVMADPDFDRASESNQPDNRQNPARDINGMSAASGVNKTANEPTGPKLGDVEFEPLKRLVASAQEAEAVQKALDQATAFLGSDATESALKQVSSPSILHIATHGFFLEEEIKPGARSTRAVVRRRQNDSTSSVKLDNPTLRSGLFFAGANRGKSGNDDGVLSALEAAELNLSGTKLVVLSACDTGIGEVLNGEGVQGLRRALVLAGSESQMMSLWPVSDKGTRELMTDYYKILNSGAGRSEALRLVQLKMLRNPKRRHPFYWASFIQSGEWASLKGKQ